MLQACRRSAQILLLLEHTRIWDLNCLKGGWVLVEEYMELSKISFAELNKMKKLNNVLLIGGWATHFLANEKFKEWKNTDYIDQKT